MANVQKRDSFRIVLARCIRYGVATVKVPVRLALIGGVSFGIAGGIATFAAGSFFTNLVQQAKDVYTVYRLTGERDELRTANSRLESQVSALQREYARKRKFQQEAKEKLASLDKALASAGALSLFGKSDGSDSKKKTQGEGSDSDPRASSEAKTLARVLRSPILTRDRKGVSAPQAAECKPGSECVAGAAKQKIALEVESDEGLLVQPLNEEQAEAEVRKEERELLEALDMYTVAVEKMPIGTPVFGRYSSGFGFRASPFSSHRSFHEGIDVSLPRGGKVVATGAGIVKHVSYHHHYGLTIDIEHTPQVTTRYAHLSKALVKKGQPVDRGQRIALSGASGRATGPHVHYEVLVNGRAKNPKPYVAMADSLSGVM